MLLWDNESIYVLQKILWVEQLHANENLGKELFPFVHWQELLIHPQLWTQGGRPIKDRNGTSRKKDREKK
jgi:hypothetical protein